MTPAEEQEVQELRRRLEEAEETLRAIRSGEVDALVVQGEEGERVYTLHGADHPYRTLIEAIQQGAVSLSSDGTVLYCNRCFAEMLKMPHEKVVGAKIVEFLPSSQRALFETLLRQGYTRSSQDETLFQAADGTVLPVYVALNPLPLAGAVTLCMVATDLTEQKKHQDLQDVNRRKDEFLAMLAHELRNPLAPIRNALHVIQMRGLDRRQSVRKSWDMIERQVEHLVRIVDDLLDVSRISRGKITLQKEPIDMAILVARAVESSRPLIESRKHRLEIRLPDEPVLVEADPTRMAQVLWNLLNNAAKYTPEGGDIRLTVEKQAAQCIVRVRDTGMGMPPEMLPKIFDLFTQAERTLERAEGGLGIGLSLVKKLTELHGGGVQASSAGAGQGSEFVLRLPLLSQIPPGIKPHDPNQTEPAKSSAGHRILVVDDNRDSADSLAALLRLLGHDVRTAHDGRQALDVAASYRPELVLLDIGLPVMDGFAVARHLRAQTEFSEVMLVALTGYGSEEDRQRSQVAGFNHHMVKPIRFDRLNELLAALKAPSNR